MTKVIEHIEECSACKGTGLYRGMGEGPGAAVVCHRCEGTGAYKYRREHKEFTGRVERQGIKRVYQSTCGYMIGEGNGRIFEDFGGMPYEDWASGKPFPKGSEDRKHTCPAHWYQLVDHDKKPHWDECIGCGAFSACESFPNKDKCWEKFDKEEKERGGK